MQDLRVAGSPHGLRTTKLLAAIHHMPRGATTQQAVPGMRTRRVHRRFPLVAAFSAIAFGVIVLTALLLPVTAPAALTSAHASSAQKRHGKHPHHHKRRHRRRTIKSHGGPLGVGIGALQVRAPKGAIRKGQTLTIQTVPESRSAHGTSSIAAGPYAISTSQGEPRKPVEVTFSYKPGLLHRGDHALVLHDSTIAHGWIPVGGTVDPRANTISAKIGSFSLVDVVDDATYYASMRTAPPCQAAFPDARRKTIGRTTWYNRQESMRLVLCYRFGLNPSADFPISAGMVCGMLAEVIGHGIAEKLGLFTTGACSGAEIASDPGEPTKYIGAVCGWASALLKSVPAALGCTFAPSAGTSLGSLFESKHELDVAVDVAQHGKCIKYSPTHFGSPWLAVNCAPGDPAFADLPLAPTGSGDVGGSSGGGPGGGAGESATGGGGGGETGVGQEEGEELGESTPMPITGNLPIQRIIPSGDLGPYYANFWASGITSDGTRLFYTLSDGSEFNRHEFNTVTGSDHVVGQPYWPSGDGSALYWEGIYEPQGEPSTAQVYSEDVPTGTVSRLTGPNESAIAPESSARLEAVSDDGSIVIYERQGPFEYIEGRYEWPVFLYSLDRDTSETTLLSKDGDGTAMAARSVTYSSYAALSPNGRYALIYLDRYPGGVVPSHVEPAGYRLVDLSTGAMTTVDSPEGAPDPPFGLLEGDPVDDASHIYFSDGEGGALVYSDSSTTLVPRPASTSDPASYIGVTSNGKVWIEESSSGGRGCSTYSLPPYWFFVDTNTGEKWRVTGFCDNSFWLDPPAVLQHGAMFWSGPDYAGVVRLP